MRMIKDFGQACLSWKWSLWILFLFPYGWMLKSALIRVSNELEVSINRWDLIIDFFINPFLVIYLLFPILLLLFSRVILYHAGYTTLIRIRSHTRWIFYAIGKVIPTLLLLFIFWIVISFMVAITLPVQTSWSPYAVGDYGVNYMIYSSQQYFAHPSSAMLVQILQYLVFLITVYTIMTTIYLFRPKSSTLVILSVCFYVGTIISFKIPTEWVWLHMTNYLFTYASIGNFQSVVLPFGVLTIIFLGCLVVVKLFKK